MSNGAVGSFITSKQVATRQGKLNTVGYAKTPSEVDEVQGLIKSLSYATDGVRVRFHTEPDFIREVLPPCFDMPDEPLASVSVIRELTEIVGYRGASLNVRARFGQIEGWYHLSLLYTGDMPVTIGREMLGEPKKRAEVSLSAENGSVRGFADRNGTRLIHVDGVVRNEIDAQSEERHYNFNVRAFPNGDLSGLEYPPVLIVEQPSYQHGVLYSVDAELELTSSSTDPCGTVPIVSVDSAQFWQGRRTVPSNSSEYPAEYVLPHTNEYLPFVLGRDYDLIVDRERNQGLRNGS